MTDPIITRYVQAPSGACFQAPTHEETDALHKELFQLFRQRVIPVGIEAKDLDFTLETRRLTYIEKATGRQHTADLLELDAQEMEPVFAKIQDCFHITLKNSDYAPAKDSKGNTKGTKLLIRDGELLQQLPRTFAECSKDYIPQALVHLSRPEQLVVVKRLLFAEAFYKKFSSGLDHLIQMKTQARANPRSDQEELQLQRDIQQLQLLRDRLNKLDTYALTSVLTHYPTSSNSPTIQAETLKSSIERATSSLTDHLFEAKKKSTSSLSRGIIKMKELFRQVEKEKEEIRQDPTHQPYVKDLQGMFHLSRHDYLGFCHKEGIQAKQESIEDMFLRKAIAYADGKPQPNTPMLFDSLLDVGKRELEAILQAISFQEILPSIEEEFQLEERFPIPSTATDQQKTRILQQRLEQTKSDFAAIRSRIRWNIEEEEIFEDAQEEFSPTQGSTHETVEDIEEEIFEDAQENFPPAQEQASIAPSSFFNRVQNAFSSLQGRAHYLGTAFSALRARITALRERIDWPIVSSLQERTNQIALRLSALRTRIDSVRDTIWTPFSQRVRVIRASSTNRS